MEIMPVVNEKYLKTVRQTNKQTNKDLTTECTTFLDRAVLTRWRTFLRCTSTPGREDDEDDGVADDATAWLASVTPMGQSCKLPTLGKRKKTEIQVDE